MTEAEVLTARVMRLETEIARLLQEIDDQAVEVLELKEKIAALEGTLDEERREGTYHE